MAVTASTLSHLECSLCAAVLAADRPANLCPCGGVLLARYDLAAAARTLTRAELAGRRRGLWRYAEVLPVRRSENVVDLGEGSTPLLPSRLGRELGIERLWIKDESLNPTGSFKARGMATAVSRMKELGLLRGVVPTAGNAGLAFAAYAARAGIAARVIAPADAPAAFAHACRLLGAEVVEVAGTIADAGALAARAVRAEGYFDLSTLKEPYRAEGKKTMGYELWEEMEELPDAIVYPTGGGTGLIGMWKAFAELEAMGLTGRRRPRMIAVQAEGCAPVVRAFAAGLETTAPWPAPATAAAGLRVPSPYAGRLMLKALRESGGTAVALPDGAILEGARRMARTDGVLASPEAGAALAALAVLLKRKLVDRDERIVLFATGGGAMYLDLLAPAPVPGDAPRPAPCSGGNAE